MFQVLYEYPVAWPEEGGLRVEAQFTSEINISPAVARRRANGFLTGQVTMMVLAGEPVLVLGEERPVWRVPACLHLPDLGEVTTVGTIDVDALTGQVIPPLAKQLTLMQRRANEIATRLTPTTTPAS